MKTATTRHSSQPVVYFWQTTIKSAWSSTLASSGLLNSGALASWSLQPRTLPEKKQPTFSGSPSAFVRPRWLTSERSSRVRSSTSCVSPRTSSFFGWCPCRSISGMSASMRGNCSKTCDAQRTSCAGELRLAWKHSRKSASPSTAVSTSFTPSTSTSGTALMYFSRGFSDAPDLMASRCVYVWKGARKRSSESDTGSQRSVPKRRSVSARGVAVKSTLAALPTAASTFWIQMPSSGMPRCASSMITMVRPSPTLSGPGQEVNFWSSERTTPGWHRSSGSCAALSARRMGKAAPRPAQNLRARRWNWSSRSTA
mmetsp:Transcript_90064/g.232456  ORF Transcript_90064/g.232456 Transcript_90064/m.232456 type:complete len:312 (+) Transcript_90064:222-1157(+)